MSKRFSIDHAYVSTVIYMYYVLFGVAEEAQYMNFLFVACICSDGTILYTIIECS